jgi:hypothetical protein
MAFICRLTQSIPSWLLGSVSAHCELPTETETSSSIIHFNNSVETRFLTNSEKIFKHLRESLGRPTRDHSTSRPTSPTARNKQLAVHTVSQNILPDKQQTSNEMWSTMQGNYLQSNSYHNDTLQSPTSSPADHSLLHLYLHS